MNPNQSKTRFHQFLFLISLVCLALFQCNHSIREHVLSKNIPIRVYLEPTVTDIDIYFLRSISSKSVSKDLEAEFKKKVLEQHANWFHTRLKAALLKEGIAVVNRDRANIILESKIVDLAEVRPRLFLEGLSVGLVLGAIVAELTGKPEVGAAVFVWEIIEEFVILYLLKTYFMITTIELTAKTPEGNILKTSEFRSYSYDEYNESLPEFTKYLRENKVRGSLAVNAKQIARFLKDLDK